MESPNPRRIAAINGPFYFGEVLCTEKLRNHNGPPGSNSDDQCNKGKDDRKGSTHRCQRLFAQEAPHDNLVHKSIELLEHMPHQHGYGKTENIPAFTSLG